MASLPAPDAPIDGLMAEKSDDIVLIRVDQIDKGERLRAVDPVWADALGSVMAREGQNTPIEVCRLPGRTRWTLVSGAHRHTGAELHDIAYLKAIIVSADRASRRLREISENLWRRDLDPIDRAAFLAELVLLKRTQAGLDVASQRDAKVSQRFKDRIDSEATEHLDTMSTCYGWSDEVADQIGLSSRSIRRDLMLFRGLSPSIVAALRDARHPMYRNATQLRSLAKLSPADQPRIVDQLLAGTAKTVNEAIARTRGSNKAIDPEAKRLSAFLGAFSRMGLAEKKGALAQLAAQLPAGFTLFDQDGVMLP